MKKETFTFDSRDGRSHIHAVRYSPDSAAPKAIIQIIHGMSEYVERYEPFAKFLTAHGYLVTGEDHLGHGRTVPADGSYGYFCGQDPATVLVRDVHRLKKMTQALYPGLPVIIIGHSMGSFILRNYLCRYGSGIDAAVIMGTGMQSPALVRSAKLLSCLQKKLFGGKHVGHLLDRLAFGAYSARIRQPATSFDWLSRDPEEVRKYVEDPLCGFTFTVNGFQTLFELISRIQKTENLEKIPRGLPLLLISGDADPVGDYGEGVRRTQESLRKAGLTQITEKLYEGARHELLNETNRTQVMEDILDWIQRSVPDESVQ